MSAAPRIETEAEALDSVLRKLAPDVRRWVARHLGPGPDLDDATQEALIELADALGRFEGRSKLTTYAHRIAVRVAIRHAKKHRRRSSRTLALVDGDGPSGPTPEAVALGREGVARLYDALDRMRPDRRAAFVLCDVENLPHAEAAEVENVKLETMRKRLTRARAELRKRLEGDPVLGPYLAGGAT